MRTERKRGRALTIPGPAVILLADDNALFRYFAKTILTREGYLVLEADEGQSALALVREPVRGVDLLVTDIEMPGMDGLALAKALRKTHANIPVIYTSAAASLPAKRVVKGSAFIPKPFHANVLLQAVNAMLSHSHAELTIS